MIQHWTNHSRLLAIDSSTSNLSVAILEGEQLLRGSHNHSERNHSLFLMPMIQELLQSLQLKPADLDGIAVGLGPGSYTGVRIGVTVAKTMAWTLQLPVIGVSSLEATARGGWIQQGEGEAWVIPFVNARRGQVYTALYAGGGSQWSTLVPDRIQLMHDWINELLDLAKQVEYPPQRILFIGDATPFLIQIEQVREQWKGTIELGSYSLEALYIGKLAFQRYSGFQPADVHGLIPNYAQLTEAEVNLRNKHNQLPI